MKLRSRGPRKKHEDIYPRIKELLNTRMTYSEISKEVGVSIATVGRVYKMVLSEDTHGN